MKHAPWISNLSFFNEAMPGADEIFAEIDKKMNAGVGKQAKISSFNYFDHFKIEEGYLLPNPVLEIGVNNSIKLRASQFVQLIEQDPFYTEKIKNTIGYTLSDEELIILYWAKKCRSCLFIQDQLKIDDSILQQIIGKLQDMDIVQIMPLNAKLGWMQQYMACQEFITAPENLNLRHQWGKSVALFADKIYISDRNDDTFYTYKEFDVIVRYITSTLKENNVGKGDKIILHADTNFEAIGLFWACMQLGIVFMPVNSSLAEVLIEGLIEKHNPKLVFLSHDTGFYQKLKDRIVFFDDEVKTGSTLPDRLLFSAWLGESGEIQNLPEIDENDLALILHTSGSTGVPKGVQLTHGQLFQSAVNLVKTYSWSEKDSFFTTNDLDSITGLRTACTTTVEAGGTFIIPDFKDRNSLTELLSCIYDTGVTCVCTGPSLLKQLLAKKDVKGKLSNVTCITSAGSALTTHLKTEFFEKTNKRIFNLYGLTETAGLVIGVPLSSTSLKGNFIGHPVDCLVKIVDDNNSNVKIGEVGELLLYGYTVFKGYYGDDEPGTNEVQQWFATGDLAKMDPDGSIELTGRKKDFMKNARGEIVYFSEIEEALKPLPFIKETGMIAFFQDESERGALFIEPESSFAVPKNIVEEIKKELKTRLGSNKIPAIIKVIEKIPRNKYGKLLKTELNKFI